MSGAAVSSSRRSSAPTHHGAAWAVAWGRGTGVCRRAPRRNDIHCADGRQIDTPQTGVVPPTGTIVMQGATRRRTSRSRVPLLSCGRGCCVSDRPAPPASVDDVHAAARAMPHVTVARGGGDNPVYQVGGKSFVYFRTPRPDAVDPATGERYDDVIIIWVASDGEKRALVEDPDSPFFTTSHFDGHPSVLVRASHLGEVDRDELVELVQEAWLSRASRRRANAWLAEHDLPLIE